MIPNTSICTIGSVTGGNISLTINRNSKHKEGNDEKRNEIIPDPTSLGISQSENSYVKPSDSTPIWSFMLRNTEPEPEQVIFFLLILI